MLISLIYHNEKENTNITWMTRSWIWWMSQPNGLPWGDWWSRLILDRSTQMAICKKVW